jgi:hypothetical protein
MAKLTYTKLRSGGKGRFDLMVDAKVKELIDYYGLSCWANFCVEWAKWISSIKKKNSHPIENAYRISNDNGVGQIWRQYPDLHKDPILIYEIREEVSNG